MRTPKVFVSHASEDKDRFVLGFAERLRGRGIDAWVDKWEILPGDSLVEKIFEEGLKSADAVIIVLSSNSVQKPWVREELNASIVKKINSKAKIIPVLIDNCDVPESLKSTVWERIDRLDHYDCELERIVASIFEHRQRPPLGSPPEYATTETIPIRGLTHINNLVLKIAGDTVFQKDCAFVDGEQFISACGDIGIGRDSVIESLHVLANRGYIELREHMGGIGFFTMSTSGKDHYASAYIEHSPGAMRKVALDIINQQAQSKVAISQRLQFPPALVDLILEKFSAQGLVQVVRTAGDVTVIRVSPELKRAFGND